MTAQVIPLRKPVRNASAITLAQRAIDRLEMFDAIAIDESGNILEPGQARRARALAIRHLQAAQKILSSTEG